MSDIPHDPTAFEEVTRTMVAGLQKEIHELKVDIDGLRDDIKELFTQLNRRLPPWVAILISALTFLVGILAAAKTT